MNPKIHKLFHALWTKAVGTPEYDRHEWQALEEHILLLETTLDVLQFLDEEGDRHGRCVYCRKSPCQTDCRIQGALKKSGRKP